MENVKTVAGGSLLLTGSGLSPLSPIGAVLPPPRGAAPRRATDAAMVPPPPVGGPMAQPPVNAGIVAPGAPEPTPQRTMPSTVAQPAPPPTPTTVLDDLVDQFHDAAGAILASVDGFSIAQSSSMSDEASHPAMLAAAVGLAHQIVSMSGGEELRQLVVEHDRGLLLAWPIGSQRVLAVLAQHSIDQRRLHSFVHARTQVLIGAGS